MDEQNVLATQAFFSCYTSITAEEGLRGQNILFIH